MVGLVAGSHSRNDLHVKQGSEENRPPTRQPAPKTCRVCGDEIGLKENSGLFVPCHECGIPVCRPCCEYERSEGNQRCFGCNTRYKRHKGCLRVAGDEEENFDADDSEEEFQIKSRHDDNQDQKHMTTLSEHGDYNQQPWHLDSPGSFTGNGDKEAYSSAEWQERVEKWKIRQEKRGLVIKDDGGNDQRDEDDLYLAEARQPLWRKIFIPSSKISPYCIVIVLRFIILGCFFVSVS